MVVCPSEKFIAALPYGKIPDRSDFINLTPEQRLTYWQQVFLDSETLATEFNQFYHSQNISSIKNINQLLT